MDKADAAMETVKSAISEYNPNNGMITVMLSNYGDNVWARMRKIRKEMY